MHFDQEALLQITPWERIGAGGKYSLLMISFLFFRGFRCDWFVFPNKTPVSGNFKLPNHMTSSRVLFVPTVCTWVHFLDRQLPVIIQHSQPLFVVLVPAWVVRLNSNTGVFSLLCFMFWSIPHAVFIWQGRTSLSPPVFGSSAERYGVAGGFTRRPSPCGSSASKDVQWDGLQTVPKKHKGETQSQCQQVSRSRWRTEPLWILFISPSSTDTNWE